MALLWVQLSTSLWSGPLVLDQNSHVIFPHAAMCLKVYKAELAVVLKL